MFGITELDTYFMAIEPVEYLGANNRWQKVLIRGYQPVFKNGTWEIQVMLIPSEEQEAVLPRHIRAMLEEIIYTSHEQVFPLLRTPQCYVK